MRKKVYIVLFFYIFSLFIFASGRSMPDFITRYDSWINYLYFDNGHCYFHIYNYETSFFPQVTGLSCDGWDNLYGDRVAKYIIKHRNDLEQSVVVYCDFFKSHEKWKYKELKECFSSFKLCFDKNELDITDMFCKDISTEDYSLASGDEYYSLSFLCYIDKDIFIKISESKSFYLTCKVNNNDYHFDLQIPVVYDDTFQIKPKEELNLPEW